MRSASSSIAEAWPMALPISTPSCSSGPNAAGYPHFVETNALCYFDNLDALRRHVADASVDLVYFGPPFNSDANYNVLFADHGENIDYPNVTGSNVALRRAARVSTAVPAQAALFGDEDSG